ncbi:MAG: hypothetical protein FJZ16_01650 [Candidatus Omnitrophica bacterium]|nr:hypothetical protein [Candidatus Omnitrophota bacterium]
MNTRQAERIILGVVLEDKEALSEVKNSLCADDFREPNIRRVILTLFNMEIKDTARISNILCQFEDEPTRDLISEVLLEVDKLSDKRKNLFDCIRWIKQDNLKKTLKEIQQKIKLAQEIKNESLMFELVSKYNNLVKRQRQELL